MKTLFSLLAGWLLRFTGALLAQPITVTTVTDTFTQCGPSQTFTVTIHNSTANTLPAYSIRIQLPSCVWYDSGRFSGTDFTIPYENVIGDSLHVNYTTSVAAFGTARLRSNPVLSVAPPADQL